MEIPKKYKITLTKDAVEDIKQTKRYVLKTFKYREYAENFSKKIRLAINKLNPFAEGYETTGFQIDGFDVYFKPYSTYLIFFIVDGNNVVVIRVLKDRMYWQLIIKRMKK